MTVTIYNEKGLREELTHVFDICQLPDDKMHIHFHRKGDNKKHTYYMPLIAHISINFNDERDNEHEEEGRS